MRYTYSQRRMLAMYRLELYRGVKHKGKWDIPEVETRREIPDFDRLVAYNEIRGKDLSRCGVHFFIDDYQFERLWNNPHRYCRELKGAAFVLTPDFSLFTDMPIVQQMYNVYRNRLIGAYFYTLCVKVIPTLSWSDSRSYDFCFEGVAQGNVVAVSDNGCLATEEARRLWMEGFEEMKRRIHPEAILLYGSGKRLEGNDNIIYCENENLARLRNHGRQR